MRNRLLAAFLAIALAILVIQDLPLASHLQTVERDNVLLALQRDAWGIASAGETSLVSRDAATLGTLASGYSAASDARVDIVDANGTVLASTKQGELGFDYSNRPEITAALTGTPNTGERDSDLLGGRMLYVAVPVRSGTAVAGAVRLTYPVASVDSIVQARVRNIYLTGLLTLLMAATFAFLLAGIYTRRLRRIHAATEQLASGDLSARVTETDGGVEELRGLEQAFNLMAVRLQTLVESQQSFASDASHQLRTPLTALRLRLENAAREAADADATERSLDAAIIEVQRLQTLIDGLLALARLEGDATRRTETTVDAVMSERRDLWTPLAEERELALSFDVPAALSVVESSDALAQVLDTYLDNAIEFAPAGSAIKVSAVPSDHHIEFHVVDNGPGMDAQARQRAFDRFWRGRADGSGTGLGLAIAARLAQVSGGSVRLDAAQPSGIDAVLVLPRAVSRR